jgi:hypothetical protein
MMNLVGTNPLLSHPLFKRAQEMAAGKSNEELQKIALNLCKERGLDFEEAFAAFQKQFGISQK